MLKRRGYIGTDVLDEVLADSDGDFAPDMADANGKKSEIWLATQIYYETSKLL